MKKTSLKKSEIFFYGLPMVSGGFINFVIANYLLKFATDTLAIAPTVVGTIFAISRIYDAVTDPLCGYLIDHYPIGKSRRVNFIFLSGFFLFIGFYMLFLYPELSFLAKFFPNRAMWFSLSLVILFTGLTLLYIPHYSLACDLSYSQEEQAKLYGTRSLLENVGTFLGVFFVAIESEKVFLGNFLLKITTGLFLFLNIFLLRLTIKEKPSSPISQTEPFFMSLLLVLKNKNSKKALFVTFLAQLAASLMLSTLLYFCQYVLNKSSLGPQVAAIFLFSATLAIPFWVFFLQRKPYYEVWPFVLAILTFLFLSSWPGGKIYPANLLLLLGGLIGFFAGALLTINPLALAQAIPSSHEKVSRKASGIYFAIYTFVNKMAMAFAVFLVGIVLGATGFKGGQEQSALVKETIRLLFAIVPAFCFLLAFVISTRPKTSLP